MTSERPARRRLVIIHTHTRTRVVRDRASFDDDDAKRQKSKEEGKRVSGWVENTNRRATDRCATLAHRDRDQDRAGARAKPSVFTLHKIRNDDS